MPRPAPRVAPATRATPAFQRHRPSPVRAVSRTPENAPCRWTGPGERDTLQPEAVRAGAARLGRSGGGQSGHCPARARANAAALQQGRADRRACRPARHALGRLASHSKPSDAMRYPLFLVRQLSRTLSKKLVRTGARHLPFVPKELYARSSSAGCAAARTGASCVSPTRSWSRSARAGGPGCACCCRASISCSTAWASAR